MSIKYKIAFLFSLLVMLILALVSLAIYYFSVKEREDSFKLRLERRAQYIAKMYSNSSDSDVTVLRRIDVSSTAFYKKSTSLTGYNDSYIYMYADSTHDSLFL